jgi:hypothetical protein
MIAHAGEVSAPDASQQILNAFSVLSIIFDVPAVAAVFGTAAIRVIG